MKRSVLVTAVALGALMIVCGAKAQAGLHICNKTSHSVSTAVAFAWDWDYLTGDDAPAHWRVEGWWNIDPGDCTTPIGAALDTSGDTEYYYYAHDSDGDTWDGETRFCVDSTYRFEYNEDDDDRCTTGVHEKFRDIKTNYSADFTLNLTP